MKQKRKTTSRERRESRSKVRAEAKKKAAGEEVPDSLKGKRPLNFEYSERTNAVRRLRRAGLTVPAIAQYLGVSDSSVRRSIRAYNRIARSKLNLDVEADLRGDLEIISDDLSKIEEAIVRDPSARDLANLIRARTDLVKTKHVILRDINIRQPMLPPVVDERLLKQARHMSDKELDRERAHLMRTIAEAAGLTVLIDDGEARRFGD
ncbi:helix-turn-helix domain-containing protein [Acidobacteriota bacterium]